MPKTIKLSSKYLDYNYAQKKKSRARKAALFNHPDGAAYDLVVELVSMEEYQ